MRIAICPGSFDPITNGHLDIIARAAKLFDHVEVAVLQNSSKKCVFSVEERVDMIRDCIGELPNVSASSFDGLLVDYAKKIGATAIVKGLRAVSDFESEVQMAIINNKLNPHLETVFLPSSPKYTYLSSTIVKEMARYGCNLADFIPREIIDEVNQRMNEL
jgi:pantetheine-phosphate adenylyltransferase